MKMPENELRAFKNSAAFYDTLFDAETRLQGEGSFLEKVLQQAPGSRVADLACGTGPHALFFAELGAEVDAFDLSEDMIAHAAALRSHPRIAWRQGDMTELEGGPWDLAVCLGNSISLLPDRDAVAETLRHTAAHLNPGGLFLIQILNYKKNTGEPSHKVVRKKNARGIEVTAVKSLVPERDRTLLSLAFYARQENAWESLAESAVLLHLRREELTEMAEKTGLETAAVYGGFDESRFDPPSSPDLIMIFRKP
jgi:glycine/sarcosine N-methyltransferase